VTWATSRVALVTGASSGVGAATARLLAARGMRVVVDYLHSAQAAEEVVAGIEAAGGQAMAVQADARDPTAVQALVERVAEAWGGVDVLVHNALTPYAIKSFQDMTWEELGGKLDDEMRAAFVVTKAVLPAMIERGGGRLIYLGAWHTPDEIRAHYKTFIAPHFTTDGRADLAAGATAVAAVAAELGVPATVTAADFYCTA